MRTLPRPETVRRHGVVTRRSTHLSVHHLLLRTLPTPGKSIQSALHLGRGIGVRGWARPVETGGVGGGGGGDRGGGGGGGDSPPGVGGGEGETGGGVVGVMIPSSTLFTRPQYTARRAYQLVRCSLPPRHLAVVRDSRRPRCQPSLSLPLEASKSATKMTEDWRGHTPILGVAQQGDLRRDSPRSWRAWAGSCHSHNLTRGGTICRGRDPNRRRRRTIVAAVPAEVPAANTLGPEAVRAARLLPRTRPSDPVRARWREA